MMAWLDLLAHPQISIPYVHIGFIMVLESNLKQKDMLESLLGSAMAREGS
jgi:hypothetical protein